jgi:hypothetical protein
MLIRFTGLSADNPYNWNDNLDVDGIKANANQQWAIRWWKNKRMAVKQILEQMQFEFGFIFKWRVDGSPSYWCIKDSYSSSDVQAIITDKDGKLEKNGIKASPFSQLTTKMNINYEKHPAEDRYISSKTGTNSTARTKWKIEDAENIKDIDLDMNVLDPIPVGTDPNDGLYRYLNNILGDVKVLVNYNITNPKWYGLETGDTIQFNLASIAPFGYVWTDLYFFIEDHKRGLNSLKIKARQVFSD